MAITINTNTAASFAASGLNSSNNMLQQSLNRLSSGKKIISPADDAGGLAVSMKMEAAIKRTGAVQTGVGNSKSFLQTQDGALKTAASILDRISELKTLYEDPTKNAEDKTNYDQEFTELVGQMGNLESETFNGQALFASGTTATQLSVITTEDGGTTVNINQGALGEQVKGAVEDGGSAATSLSQITSIGAITGAIQNVAAMRATNGGQTSRLNFADQQLETNKTNLEAANSRIIDTDVASESTRFAKYQILTQSGTAMLAQANQSSSLALRLLG